MHIIMGWVEEEVCYLLQTTALSVTWLFEKYVSVPNPQKASVGYIKNNPVSSLPLLKQ